MIISSKTLRSVTFGLTLLAIAMTQGCKKDGASGAASSAKPKIGFLLLTFQEERYAKDRKYFEDKVAALGGETIFASANNSEQEQLAKVENLLSQGVKVLVIQPVQSKAAAAFVSLAHKDGVKVVAYDRVINDAPLDLYVTQDSYSVGVLQAEAAVAFTKGKGNYIILQGESGHSVAAEITRGVMDTLKKYPGIKVVANQAHASWSGEAAMKTVENALTANKDKIAAILANNSGMANGAVQALKERKTLLGKVFVAGADADLTAMKNLVAGAQQFEVLKAIEPLASKAAEAAVSIAKGEAIIGDSEMDVGAGFKAPIINTPVYPVTKADIEERIIKTGFHTKEAIYGTN